MLLKIGQYKIFLLILVAITLLASFFVLTNLQNNSDQQKVFFEVSKVGDKSELKEEIEKNEMVKIGRLTNLLLSIYPANKIQAGVYELPSDGGVWDTVSSLVSGPKGQYLKLDSKKVIDFFNGDKEKARIFVSDLNKKLYRGIDNDSVASGLQLDELESLVFAEMYEDKQIPLLSLFENEKFLIQEELKAKETAKEVYNQIKSKYLQDDIENKILQDDKFLSQTKELLFEKGELLPELVMLPPEDISLHEEGGELRLFFSTTYWNRGLGPLELVPDDSISDQQGDVDADIFQRVYNLAGDYRQEQVGTFLWHDPHDHYHFSDFAEYTLKPINDNQDIDTVSQKATFCVADEMLVEDQLTGYSGREFIECGQEKQGVSVGWGDTYEHTLPDQYLEVTDLPTGEYELIMEANPERIFRELNYDKNKSSVIVYINTEEKYLELVE